MRQFLKILFYPGALLIAAYLSIVVPGCGGGSEGSGFKTFQGTILDSSDSSPIANLQVTLAETGESASTDAQGMFTLVSNSNLGGSSATLLLDGGSSISTSVAVDGLPSGEAQISVKVAVDRNRNSARVTEVQIRTPATPTSEPVQTRPPATSTPVEQPGNTPVPTPIDVPTTQPTNEPGVTPTRRPTSAATRTPTRTPTHRPYTACDFDTDNTGRVTANDLQAALDLYVSGNFDFNRDGVTNASDLQAFQDGFDEFFGATCP